MGGLGVGPRQQAIDDHEPIEKQKVGIVNTLFDMNDRMRGFSGALEESMQNLYKNG
jgi:hypothetical protein